MDRAREALGLSLGLTAGAAAAAAPDSLPGSHTQGPSPAAAGGAGGGGGTGGGAGASSPPVARQYSFQRPTPPHRGHQRTGSWGGSPRTRGAAVEFTLPSPSALAQPPATPSSLNRRRATDADELTRPAGLALPSAGASGASPPASLGGGEYKYGIVFDDATFRAVGERAVNAVALFVVPRDGSAPTTFFRLVRLQSGARDDSSPGAVVLCGRFKQLRALCQFAPSAVPAEALQAHAESEVRWLLLQVVCRVLHSRCVAQTQRFDRMDFPLHDVEAGPADGSPARGHRRTPTEQLLPPVTSRSKTQHQRLREAVHAREALLQQQGHSQLSGVGAAAPRVKGGFVVLHGGKGCGKSALVSQASARFALRAPVV